MKTTTERFHGLWHNADFRKLWIGETVSLFGTQMTTLALPLLAAVRLQATPTQMGELVASQFAPYLLFSLFAGVWIDQCRRRPILVAANIGRCVLLGAIPLLSLLGHLSLVLLNLLVFFTSTLSVFFELAYQSYLPTIIHREDLVEGNSKLQLSASLAQVSGPNLAGILVDWLTAPIVVLIDAFSYLVSAVCVAKIKKTEQPPERNEERGSLWHEIGFGFTSVFRNPYLRAIAFEAATYNFFSMVTSSALILYMTREMHMSAKLLGLIMGGASVGSLVGSLTARPIGQRFGTGLSIIGSMLVACAAPLIVPLAQGSFVEVAVLDMVSFFLGGFGLVISVVQVISLRQAIIPEQQLGRVNACYRFVCSAATPIGALLGGQLGGLLGLRSTLLIGAVGTILAVSWVLFSPVAKLTRPPMPTGTSSDVTLEV